MPTIGQAVVVVLGQPESQHLLQVSTLCSCRSVCKEWMTVLSTRDIWEGIFNRDFPKQRPEHIYRRNRRGKGRQKKLRTFDWMNHYAHHVQKLRGEERRDKKEERQCSLRKQICKMHRKILWQEEEGATNSYAVLMIDDEVWDPLEICLDLTEMYLPQEIPNLEAHLAALVKLDVKMDISDYSQTAQAARRNRDVISFLSYRECSFPRPFCAESLMSATTHCEIEVLRQKLETLRSDKPLNYCGKTFPLVKIDKSNVKLLNQDQD